jgi:hypothetical protein
MWPAMLPVMLRRIARSTPSNNEVPTTTKNAPKPMMPPTINVFHLLANRLRNAISATTRNVSNSGCIRRPRVQLLARA